MSIHLVSHKHKASEQALMGGYREADAFDRASAPTSTVRWAMMALWCPSRVSSAMVEISASDLPINIWQAVANISLFWPWIFTWKRIPKENVKKK